MSKIIHFETVKPIHIKTLLSWFSENHVKEFYYGEGLENTLRNLELYCKGINNNGSYSFEHWIASYNKVPFAFLMISPVTGPFDPNDDYDKWYAEDKKTFTLDLLIGNKDFLGKGIAHELIHDFILSQYSFADVFIIDPESKNTKAIHVYEKVGFKKVGEFLPAFNPKPHIMMRVDVAQLKNYKDNCDDDR